MDQVPTHGLLNVVSAPHLGEASTYRPVSTTSSKQKATAEAGGSEEEKGQGEEEVPADNSDGASSGGKEEDAEEGGAESKRPAESVNARMEDDLEISDDDLARAHHAMVPKSVITF